MVSALSFSQPYLCIQATLQSPPENRLTTSVNFHLPIPLLLVRKIILTIPSNITFPYTSAIFHQTLFAYSLQPMQLSAPKIFSLPQPFHQCLRH